MKAKRKEWKTGWWFSWLADAWNKTAGFEKFVTPWLSVTLWHKSTLASIPGFADTWSCGLSCGWWSWRLHLTLGYTLRKAEQEG
jgi:hypothetical protein